LHLYGENKILLRIGCNIDLGTSELSAQEGYALLLKLEDIPELSPSRD
jgi:hypothetical protein